MSTVATDSINFKTVPAWSVDRVCRDDASNGLYNAFAFEDANDKHRDKVKLARDDAHREWLETHTACRGWTQIASWIHTAVVDHTHYYLHLFSFGIGNSKRRMWMIVHQTRTRQSTYQHTPVCRVQLDRIKLPPSSFANLTCLPLDCSPQRSTATPHSSPKYLQRSLATPPLSRQSSLQLQREKSLAEFESFCARSMCQPNETSVERNYALISPSASPDTPLPELVANRTCVGMQSNETHEPQAPRLTDSSFISGTSVIIGIVCLVMLSLMIAGISYILQLKQRMSRLKRANVYKTAESGSEKEGAVEAKYGLRAVEFITEGEGLESKDVAEKIRAISRVTMEDKGEPERELSNELFAEHTKGNL